MTALSSLTHSDSSRPDPNTRQILAATPENIVWVGASAGSGKTKVLTDRVLRLLLPDPDGRWEGTPPHRILCITFTKAAAAEMALRVQKRLGEWAVMDEPSLLESLCQLTGKPAASCQSLIAPARRLFAENLESSGQISITTIHSFCQSVLGRFPIEAGLNPDFTVLEERAARHLLMDCLTATLQDAREQQKGEIGGAFSRLAPDLTLDDLAGALQTVLKNPKKLTALAGDSPTLSKIKSHILRGFGLAEGENEETLFAAFLARLPEKALRAAIAVMANDGGKKLANTAAGLQEWLDCPIEGKFAQIHVLYGALLTKKKEPLKFEKFMDANPEISSLVEDITEDLLSLDDRFAQLRQAGSTADLILLAGEILGRYQRAKKSRGALDFDDLILTTRDLLERTEGAWVHYKLDEGIDHILVDEAQDTNKTQWDIIRLLCSEVFSGAARESSSPRSLFVVGDEKQSIFSFQGASPEAFPEMRDFFDRKSREAGRVFESVKLETSFRTTAPVLQLVDEVFANATLLRRIGLQEGEILQHYSYREGQAGLVELWPLPETPEKENGKKSETPGWIFPFSNRDARPSETGVAGQVAQLIAGWIEREEILPSAGRPIEAGDILILVRTRGPLTHELIRQLKRKGVPVSGIDRLILGDHLAVQDCLALAKVALTPNDDFSLACLLKSPLIGWDEDQLMELALERKGALWDRLAEKDPLVFSWLQETSVRAIRQAPFEFFAETLARPCPADERGSGWRAFFRRMGMDAADPLEEFLAHCLTLESQDIVSLQHLIGAGLKDQIEIKREMEEAGSKVRIMTVHAAKGLEAGIVIMPDTTSLPQKQKMDKFFWCQDLPLWAPRSGDGSAMFRTARDTLYEKQIDEYFRLLYVALTRARDRLYVMGTPKAKTEKNPSWYTLVSEAMARIQGSETDDAGRKRLACSQTARIQQKDSLDSAASSLKEIPSWVFSTPVSEKPVRQHLAPSRMEGQDDIVLSPSEAAQNGRYRRGIVTHRLFQFLPDLSETLRTTAGKTWLDRYAADLSQDIRDNILEEVMRILHDPMFGDVFGPGSLAEVPVSGTLPDGKTINGQIDRLIIGKEKIVIVDFKTSRPSPGEESLIPASYRAQMGAYRDIIRQIYPDRALLCALLWTDRPCLMPLTLDARRD
jgi:ATP-dependent helicase/nuclease subunit A